jgi:Transposase DDE domain group 1
VFEYLPFGAGIHACIGRKLAIFLIGTHGGQQLRLFNAFHDDYGFQPIFVFDGEGRFVTALLRPGERPGGHEIRAFLRRLVGAIRANWPKVEILLRADSQYACPEVFDWGRNNRLDWVLRLAPNAALQRHVEALEKTTAERFTTAPARGKVRRFAQFHDAARSWSRVERIIARVEAGAAGTDTALSSPTWRAAAPSSFISGSTVHAARRRTTSRGGRTISPPTAPPVIRSRPTSSASSFTPVPTGSYGRCAG